MSFLGCNSRFMAALVLVLSLFSTLGQEEPQLGDAPTSPKDVSILPRQPQALISAGFSVDTTAREAVRSFYNAIYPTSDNVPMNSSSVVASCFAGTNAVDYQSAVVRRINWYRGMAGIPVNISL